MISTEEAKAASDIIHTKYLLTRHTVYYDQADTRYPKLAIFAGSDIPAGTELVL